MCDVALFVNIRCGTELADDEELAAHDALAKSMSWHETAAVVYRIERKALLARTAAILQVYLDFLAA
jgi:hypothetical protein